MPLIFVCGDFIRAGSHHSAMRGIPLLASAEAKGNLSSYKGISFLSEGDDIIEGEIYDLSEGSCKDFISLLCYLYDSETVVLKPIVARSRGTELNCHFFTLENSTNNDVASQS
ncbi:MAG: hypothetical protein ACRC9L_01935 [Brevinema sp.]